MFGRQVMTRISLVAALLAGVVGVAVAADGAGGPTGPPFVKVNGKPFEPKTGPAMLAQGELLLPLGDLLDAIGGDLTSDPSAATIIINRAGVEITLAEGERTFRVDRKDFVFALAPLVVSQLLYVDVGDLVKALGGELRWEAGYRTGDIRIEVVGFTGANIVRGTLISVVVQGTAPPFFLVREEGREDPSVFSGARRIEYSELAPRGRMVRSTLDRLRQGDSLQLALDDDRKVAKVLQTRVSVSGRLERVSGGRLFLQDGRTFVLAADVQVSTENGKPYRLEQLRRGDAVTLSTNPTDGVVLEVVVDLGGAEPPTDSSLTPQIALVAPDYRGPVKAGSELAVRLRGTPGGVATFDIGEKIQGVPMTETAPGDYLGRYVVEPRDDVSNAPVVGRLRVQGREAAPVTSTQQVTIDTTAPYFLQVSPSYLQSVETNSPSIQVEYGDGTGSGVDVTKVSVKLDDRVITQAARITPTSLSYQARNLAAGDHRLEVNLVDRAGNERLLKSIFTVEATPQNKIIAIQHDASKTLVADDKLTVTMQVAAKGRQARFVIANDWKSVNMTWVPGENVYRGTYTVGRNDELTRAVITGFFIDQDGREYRLEATTPVDIMGRLPNKLAITSPQDKQKVTQRELEIAGEAPPGRKVRVLLSYTLPLFGEKSLTTETVVADADGRWKTRPIDLLSEIGSQFTTNRNITAQLLGDDDKVEDRQRITIQLAQ